MQKEKSGSADQYFEAIRSFLNSIELSQVRAAGTLVAATLHSGGIIYVFGSGHSGLLAQEIFFRAGGLVAICPILDSRLGFTHGALESTTFERSMEAADELSRTAGFLQGDLGIVISNSGRNALPIQMALRMKDAGMRSLLRVRDSGCTGGQS